MKKYVVFVSLLLMVFASCSSAPKRPAEVFTVRTMGETQLALVNKTADQGDYEKALALLLEARRFAVSVDNPSLRVRTSLAEGNILFYLSRIDEADEAWSRALLEAENSGEKELAAQTRIYLARSALIARKSSPGEVKNQVNKEIASLKMDTLSIALGWTIIGLAEKEEGNFAAAEAAFKKALAIHDKENYLEQAAYDWYLIASARSVAGQYASAIEALNSALAFDRRAENTYGLGMDWRAMGDVYKKAGDAKAADEAYRRAAAIFRSIQRETEAAGAEARLLNP